MKEPYHILIAGQGGQGVTFLGNLLCQSAFSEGKHAAMIPEYELGIRGGLVTVRLLIDVKPVSLPFLESFHMVLRLHPSTLKVPFVPAERHLCLDAWELNAADIAHKAGFDQGVNMVLLGALIAQVPVCSESALSWTLKQMLKGERASELPLNLQLLEAGRGLVK